MKRIHIKSKHKIFHPFRNSGGFSLIEVFVSMVILSVGILGLATSFNAVTHYQKQSKDVTLATMYTTNQLENIKRIATNEPTGGVFGFGYLVDSVDGFVTVANGYTATNTRTRTASDPTPDGFTVETVITIFPTTAPAAENFDNANAIRLVDATVTTTWTDDQGNTKSVNASTVLNRRQFVQTN
jgi:Tfp pilus assembly protein PilV